MNWRDAIVFSNALTEWYNAKAGTTYTYAYYTDSNYTTPIKTSTNSIVLCTTPGCQDNPYVKADSTGFRLLTSDEWELAARYKGNDSSHGAIEYPASTGIYWTPGSYASGATANATDLTATTAVAWYNADTITTRVVKGKTANALGLYDMNGNVGEWIIDFYNNDPQIRATRGGNWACDNYPMQLGIIGGGVPYYMWSFTGFRLSRTAL